MSPQEVFQKLNEIDESRKQGHHSPTGSAVRGEIRKAEWNAKFAATNDVAGLWLAKAAALKDMLALAQQGAL